MPRLQSPSPDRGWESEASTVDLDLPPPSELFLKRKEKEKEKEKEGEEEREISEGRHIRTSGLGLSLTVGKGRGKGKGGRRRLIRAPSALLPPSTPHPQPYSYPVTSLLRPLSPDSLLNITPVPIFCCTLVKKTHPSAQFPSQCHLPSEIITPLLNSFLAFARETADGRIIDATDRLQPENRFMIVVQEVERWGPAVSNESMRERDMAVPRYFVPVVWSGEDDHERFHNEDHDMLSADHTNMNENGSKGASVGTGKTLKQTFSIINQTAETEHRLTRSLIDIEDQLDDQRRASSPHTKVLTPSFARTYPWSDDPAVKRKQDRKADWESGDFGFVEWFVTEGRGGIGKKRNVTVEELWNWVPVEGRKGRMDVKCWDCEREWVLMVRERGLTI